MIRVNLLKVEKKEAGKKAILPEAEGKEVKKKGPNVNLIILGAIVILGGLALIQKRAIDRETILHKIAEEEQATLAPVIAKLAEVEQSKIVLEKKVGLIQSLRMQQPVPVHILEELSKCLPDWVWLNEAVLRNRVLDVKGRALSNVQISDYMDALQKTGLFDSVGLRDSQQRTSGADTYVEFALNATLPPPEPASPAGPAPKRQTP
jgi:type IV pilus assembly protein PilN